jgi:tetratricopeptide (TPR) repeat protein
VNRISFVVFAAAVTIGCSAGRQAQWDTKPTQTVAAPEGFEALVIQGDEAWAKRGDQNALLAAIAAWEKASAAKPDDVAVWGKLSRAYYLLADGFYRKLGDKSPEYLETFEKGVAAGERGLAAANPAFKQHVTSGGSVEDGIKNVGKEGIEPMYWYAVNLGKWARAKGFATTLGNKDKIKAVMTRVLELDPQFFHGAADRYFGAFYAVAPGFAGGDMDKSKEHFEKSLQIAPNYAATKVNMAELYAVKKQDRELFDRLLNEVLALPDDAIPGLEPETRIEKDKANELKGKAADLF